jgi:sugar lactone lactonase YvrE
MPMWTLVSRQGVDQLGEGLFWSVRQKALFWTDIIGMKVHRLTLENGELATWDMPELVGWVIEREVQPGFIAGLKSGFAALQFEPFSITPLRVPDPHPVNNRLNDAKADARGRIWAGTMDMNCTDATGGLFRLDPDGTVQIVDTGYTVANGPAFSPDGHWMYHTDTVQRTIYRFALDLHGSVRPREPFILFPDDWGYPDGMTTDANGGLWVAHWEGGCISRFSPDGKLDRRIKLPTSLITNVAFAGPNLDRMFVTSARQGASEKLAGALFEVDARVAGVAPHLYRG